MILVVLISVLFGIAWTIIERAVADWLVAPRSLRSAPARIEQVAVWHRSQDHAPSITCTAARSAPITYRHEKTRPWPEVVAVASVL